MSIESADTAVMEIPESAARTEKNIVPRVQARERYRAKLNTHQQGRDFRLKDFLQRKRIQLRGLDLLARRKRAEDIDLMCRYFNGDQYGSYDDIGVYTDRRQDGDFAYTLPTLSGHVEQAFLQLLKVRPVYAVTSDDKDDPVMKLVAKMGKELGTKDLDRVMGPLRHTEYYNLLHAGESHRFVGWAPHPVSPKIVKRPNFKKTVRDVLARRECADCKDSLLEGMDSCPKCGSANITEIPAGQAVSHDIDGYNEVELGENTVHIPHMLAMQRDLSAVEPTDSTFFIEYSYLDKNVAEWLYQSEIEPTSLGLPIEMQLRFDLERGSNQIDAVIGSARLGTVGRDTSMGSGIHSNVALGRKQPDERHYWEPAEYGQFRSDVDEPLPDGTVLPAGKLLGDHYPKGLFVLFVGDTVMEMKACQRRRKHTMPRYGRIAGTNSGAGLKKIMPLQDAENDNFNLNQTVKHTVGHPLTAIDGHYVTELPGAGNVLKVTKAGLDDIGKVIKQWPGQSVNQGDGAQQVIEGAMQFIAGTNTVGGGSIGGAADMRAAGTATGIAAMQEQAAGRQSHAVDQIIMADKELIIQLLENIQEFSTDEQKKELIKRFGDDTVKAFFSANLRNTLTVDIESNTDMPRSMALTQANYLAFGQVAGQVLPVLEQAPWLLEFLQDLATSMGFPFSIGEGRNDRREAEYRLNVLTSIEDRLRQSSPELLTDPFAFAEALHAELAKECAPLIAMGPEEESPEAAGSDTGMPRVFLQVHSSFKDVYKDAIFSERSKSWSESYRLCVIQLWLDHHKAQMTQQVVQASLEAQMAAAMNPQPPQQEPPPDTTPTPEEVEAEKQADHQRELETKQVEHELDESAADTELDRDLIMEGHKQDGAQELERVRAANRPPPAPAGKKK